MGATVNRTAITIAKLGEGADYIRLDDSGTDSLPLGIFDSVGLKYGGRAGLGFL